MTSTYDVVIIGAGAAGLMCAIHAGKRGKRVCLMDHARKIGRKIRISGGGRCNFTNLYTSPENYLSQNPHFCKSALKQYTQYDFIDLVSAHSISFHEKKLGQLFCDNSAQDIIDMLLSETRDAGVDLWHPVTVERIEKPAEDDGFGVTTSRGLVRCESLVVATGGLSIPKAGATPFGYGVARQFGMDVLDTHAGLVPLTFQGQLLDRCKTLSGLSVDACVSFQDTEFAEGLLFTHRGLSGPSILQISSYWRERQTIQVNLATQVDLLNFLRERKVETPRQTLSVALSTHLPKRLTTHICELSKIDGRLGELSDEKLTRVAQQVHQWSVLPSGTEGYRTAEVTLGGVDTNGLSSKTMESKTCPGLYFIGEVVDVTGHLGGFNFQWAWSSGFAAGQYA